MTHCPLGDGTEYFQAGQAQDGRVGRGPHPGDLCSLLEGVGGRGGAGGTGNTLRVGQTIAYSLWFSLAGEIGPWAVGQAWALIITKVGPCSLAQDMLAEASSPFPWALACGVDGFKSRNRTRWHSWPSPWFSQRHPSPCLHPHQAGWLLASCSLCLRWKEDGRGWTLLRGAGGLSVCVRSFLSSQPIVQ